jgi:hypothetical protein
VTEVAFQEIHAPDSRLPKCKSICYEGGMLEAESALQRYGEANCDEVSAKGCYKVVHLES